MKIASFYSAARENRAPYIMVGFHSMAELLQVKTALSIHFNREVGEIPKRFKLRLRASGAVAVKLAEIVGVSDPVLNAWKPLKISYTSALTDAELIADARRYEYRVDWIRGSSSFYQTVAVRRPHLMAACTEHMGHPNDPRTSGYQVYLYEFSDGWAYIGITVIPKRRHKNHTHRGTVFEHGKKTGLDPVLRVLADNLSWKEAINLEQAELSRLKAERPMLNRRCQPSLGHLKLKYSYTSVLNAARQCVGRANFQRRFNAFYQAARRQNWVDRVAGDMRWTKNKRHPLNQTTRAHI